MIAPFIKWNILYIKYISSHIQTLQSEDLEEEWKSIDFSSNWAAIPESGCSTIILFSLCSILFLLFEANEHANTWADET